MYEAVYTGRECTQGGGTHCGVQNFFIWLLKLTNQKRPKVTCLVWYVIKVDQSQITHSKIVSEGKMPLMAKKLKLLLLPTYTS